MNIVMSYIDYNIANLDQREVFSFTKSYMSELYKKIYNSKEVLGVVIISTCNRTEIYLSLEEDCEIIPFEVLCDSMGIDFNDYIFMNKTISENDVVCHLCELSCGIKSQIWGEDQIITQVKDAIHFARAEKVTDSILEVLFRTAISSAKKVKTLVDFKSDDNSTAKRAVNIIKKTSEITDVLVIGNGAIGRLIVELLLENGINAVMTLRHYKYSQNYVPQGASTVDYNARYEAISKSHAVISATLSPHHTIKYDELIKLENIPQLFIDLAVPRDIDPKIENMKNIKYYNIDDISKDSITSSHTKQLEQIDEIITKYIDYFYKWYNYKIINVATK